MEATINKWNMISKAYRMAWADEKYKDLLLKDPVSALEKLGVHLPEGKKIVVYEETDELVFFRLPTKEVMPALDEDNKARLSWFEIVNKSVVNKEFKEQLLAEPLRVLKENGFPLQEGKKVQVVVEEAGTDILVIPPRPYSNELSDEELENVAGGGSASIKSRSSTCCETYIPRDSRRERRKRG
ncbi:MAG: hypothetical protein PHZ03_02350 [Syntrophomonas sp.]|nr:hypothetical protein [Syntrophomonas sp.]